MGCVFPMVIVSLLPHVDQMTIGKAHPTLPLVCYENLTRIKNAIGRKIFADYGPEMDVKWQLVQSIGKILQKDKFAAVDEISKLKLSRNFCLRLLAEQKLLLKDNLEMQNSQDEFFI